MELLGGMKRGKGRERNGEREIGRRNEENNEKKKEKLKNEKASEGDGIPNEIWRYGGGKEIEELGVRDL